MTAEKSEGLDSPHSLRLASKEELKPRQEMILDIEKAKQWYASFNEFKQSVIESNPAFYADIMVRGKKIRMINRSGWRAIAQAFHLNDKIIEVKEIEHQDGKNFSVVIRGLIYHEASGRSVESIGGASSDEPNKGWAPTYHNVYSIAHTRMKNRGISDIVGSGEVSSDEFTEEAQPLTSEEVKAREKAKSFGHPHLCQYCEATFNDVTEAENHCIRYHKNKPTYPLRKNPLYTGA